MNRIEKLRKLYGIPTTDEEVIEENHTRTEDALLGPFTLLHDYEKKCVSFSKEDDSDSDTEEDHDSFFEDDLHKWASSLSFESYLNDWDMLGTAPISRS